ncbi:hypothetical protein RSOL_468650 [Rhizoctonia solani AG-3 Rhs1AP]|uniref:YMC020W-like alpha/beta hydrolase domain-containing protein n=1 Tax=Rhizoctonia solani AG-3 Rhs1AP TaxID=1086054 RepID=X8JGX0_9AGAM|nr:hypothetical protein RSOL_468650 [Rhizoctonia solani AG-3 Rhs1AP]
MSAEPTNRLSKRESTSALRRDTLASTARKRSGSNASTTSKASLFTSPAKGFGLTRKASTATLAVAPVSVSGGLDHALDSVPKKATIDAGKGKSTRPVRQATRAEEFLRGVQTRAPASAAEPELPSLSESPKNIPASLPNDSAPIPVSASPASSTKTSRPKSRTSMIPVFVGSPERTKTTSSNLSTSTPAKPTSSPSRSASPRQTSRNIPTPTPSKTPSTRTQPPTSTSPRQTTSKFRAPTMPLGHGLTRKASTSSIRSATNGFKPTLSSPLAAGSKPAPPAPPKLDTGSVSAKLAVTDPSQPSPSSASWLASIPGIRINKSSVPQPTTDIVASPVEATSSPVDNNVSSSEATSVTPTPKPENHSPVSSTDSDHDALVLVTAPTSPIAEFGSNTYHINSLAAQHASSWANTPASWLAWISSAPGLSTGPQPPSSDLQGDQVMNIDSEDEALSEDNGQTPAMTPGLYDGQRMWGWGGKVRMSEESRMSGETERQATSDDKGKRPAAPVDHAVPTLPSAEVGENGTDSGAAALTIKPVTQNSLGLNSAALRYALQLPLLGRSKQSPVDYQSGTSRSENRPSGSRAPNQPPQSSGESSSNSSKPGAIVTRYSDDHDFVIIEIEVDGWILIDTEGTSPITPHPMHAQSKTARLGAAGSSLWNYYTGRGAEDPRAPGRVESTGPAAEMGDELSSPAPATEVARDTDSIRSSLLPNVLRPFGRGKDSRADIPASAPGHESAPEGTRRPKTQAELIKEEALARQSPSVVPALPSPVLNTATKSSWVSYFSSPASRSTPTMSDGRAVGQRAENAGDMEVMNIDENELTEPIEVETSTPSSPSPTTQARKVAVATSKPAAPLTDSPSIKHKASVISQGKKSSASSARSAKEAFPNLLLPAFGDTFYTVPRCVPPHTAAPPSGTTASASSGSWGLKRKVKNISTMLFNTNAPDKMAGPIVVNAEMEEYQRQALERYKLTNQANFAIVEPAVARARTPRPGSTRSYSGFGSLSIDDFGNELPRVFSVLGQGNALGDITSPIRAAVIGVHGWFPGPLVRSVFGEPTGTSVKFATMGVDALRQFAEKHDLELESITPMPLEGEGTIEHRVTKLYDDLLKHPQWLADLHRADVVLVATHSQGSIVSTHLIARLISDGHIRTRSNRDAVNHATEQTGVLPPVTPHRICCLAMCGIHMGPLYSLNSSSFAQPYLQWFESQAARELFEFQNTESEVSRNYVAALSTALDHGTKFVYIASLNDQVVPIYSGAFVAASHPLILRGLFLDGDAYSSSDFLSNLLVLLLRVKNAGLDEHGLVTHLSEATAGSLSGIGHSTAYEDLGPYTLAVRYMFETSDLAPDNNSKLSVDAFQAHASRNDYEIPWLLHSVLSDARISRIFSAEIAELRDSFSEWKPTTAVLRDIQRKLAPIRMSPLRHSMVSAADAGQESVNSKL